MSKRNQLEASHPTHSPLTIVNQTQPVSDVLANGAMRMEKDTPASTLISRPFSPAYEQSCSVTDPDNCNSNNELRKKNDQINVVQRTADDRFKQGQVNAGAVVANANQANTARYALRGSRKRQNQETDNAERDNKKKAPAAQNPPDFNPNDRSVYLYHQPRQNEHFCSHCAKCHEALTSKTSIRRCARCPFVFCYKGGCNISGFQRLYISLPKNILKAPSKFLLSDLCIYCQEKEATHNNQITVGTWIGVSDQMTTKYLHYLIHGMIYCDGDGFNKRPLYCPKKKGPLYDLSHLYEQYKNQCHLDRRMDLRTMKRKYYSSFEEALFDMQLLEHNIKVLNKQLPFGKKLGVYLNDIKKVFIDNSEDISLCPPCLGIFYEESLNKWFRMPCTRLHILAWYCHDNHWWIAKVYKCCQPGKFQISPAFVFIKIFGDNKQILGKVDHPRTKVKWSELFVYSRKRPTKLPVAKVSKKGFKKYWKWVGLYFNLQYQIPETAVPFTSKTPFYWAATLNDLGITWVQDQNRMFEEEQELEEIRRNDGIESDEDDDDEIPPDDDKDSDSEPSSDYDYDSIDEQSKY